MLERDNQGGLDASIKRIYSISLGDLEDVEDGDEITKLLVRDVLDDTAASGGMPLEKIEGMAILGKDVWIVNDNDAVDFNTGETQVSSYRELITARIIHSKYLSFHLNLTRCCSVLSIFSSLTLANLCRPF